MLFAKLESNPFTFLHIINPEFGSASHTKANTKERFDHVSDKYNEFLEDGILIQDKTPHIYSFCETILTSDQSKILLCNRILDYYNNNTVLPSDKICTTYGYMANMGHTYWNDLSAFKFLLDFDLLKHIDMFMDVVNFYSKSLIIFVIIQI